jgi:hypothetical protein
MQAYMNSPSDTLDQGGLDLFFLDNLLIQKSYSPKSQATFAPVPQAEAP